MAYKAKKNNPTLDQVIKDFNASWEYVEGSWHNRWNDNYALYNNNRVKRGYEGITDTFVPMTFSTVETMTSGLFGAKPKFSYIAQDPEDEAETDVLNGMLDYYWDKDQWSIKVINWGRDMLRYGTSVVYLYWNSDHPCMVNVPIRDFFIDPTATDKASARYMGRRFLANLDDLKTFQIVDPETGEMTDRYKNLNKIRKQTGSTNGDNTDKQEKDMFYGTTLGKEAEEQVEVIEYWTRDRCVSIANRSVVIEDTENWYKTKAKDNGDEYPEGILPFAFLRDYVDGSLFYAKGEIDFMADQQELLNDITNQNIDSITYTLNQMYTLDPAYADMINEIENLPGAVYPIAANALVPIAQRPIPSDAFNERLNIKNEIRETTASNEIIKGVNQDTNATATEIQAQIAGAGQRMGLKITQIENEGFHEVAKIVLCMIKLYVDEKQMVKVVGKAGIETKEFDPEDFKGEFEPRVMLDVSVESEKQNKAAEAKELYAAFLNDPDINQVELKRMVASRGFDLDPDDVDLLFEQPEEELPPEQPMDIPPTDMAMPPMEAGPTPEELAMLETFIDPLTGELLPAPEVPMGEL